MYVRMYVSDTMSGKHINTKQIYVRQSTFAIVQLNKVSMSVQIYIVYVSPVVGILIGSLLHP